MHSESCGLRTESFRCQQQMTELKGEEFWMLQYITQGVKKIHTKKNPKCLHRQRQMHMYYMDSSTTYSKYESILDQLCCPVSQCLRFRFIKDQSKEFYVIHCIFFMTTLHTHQRWLRLYFLKLYIQYDSATEQMCNDQLRIKCTKLTWCSVVICTGRLVNMQPFRHGRANLNGTVGDRHTKDEDGPKTHVKYLLLIFSKGSDKS